MEQKIKNNMTYQEIINSRCIYVLVVVALLSVVSFVLINKYLDTYPVILVVFVFGFVGGMISIMKRIKDLTDEEKTTLATSFINLFITPFVGGVLAIVLYLIFITDIISGPLFPQFKEYKATNAGFMSLINCTADSYKDYAKILVYSFIAGYSEGFVIKIFGKLKA